MSQIIWKYTLEVIDEQFLVVPSDAKFLSIDVQNSIPCLWALVSSDSPLAKFRVVIIGTGIPVQNIDGLQFLGTFLLLNGNFVGHVFVTHLSTPI